MATGKGHNVAATQLVRQLTILIHLLTNLYVVIGWVGAGGALVS